MSRSFLVVSFHELICALKTKRSLFTKFLFSKPVSVKCRLRARIVNNRMEQCTLSIKCWIIGHIIVIINGDQVIILCLFFCFMLIILTRHVSTNKIENNFFFKGNLHSQNKYCLKCSKYAKKEIFRSKKYCMQPNKLFSQHKVGLPSQFKTPAISHLD